MSDPVFTGQDVPDAVASAARSLGLEAARLRYVVLDPGRPGGLGVSASPGPDRRPARAAAGGGDRGPVAAPRSRGRARTSSRPRRARATSARTSASWCACWARRRPWTSRPRSKRAGRPRVRLQGAGCAHAPRGGGRGLPGPRAPPAARLPRPPDLRPAAVECEGYRDHRDEAPARAGPGAGARRWRRTASRGGRSPSTPTSGGSCTWS